MCEIVACSVLSADCEPPVVPKTMAGYSGYSRRLTTTIATALVRPKTTKISQGAIQVIS